MEAWGWGCKVRRTFHRHGMAAWLCQLPSCQLCAAGRRPRPSPHFTAGPRHAVAPAHPQEDPNRRHPTDTRTTRGLGGGGGRHRCPRPSRNTHCHVGPRGVGPVCHCARTEATPAHSRRPLRHAEQRGKAFFPAEMTLLAPDFAP